MATHRTGHNATAAEPLQVAHYLRSLNHVGE